jgi:uncharacterized protein
MNGYWSWWAGAIGLAVVTVGHYLILGTSFGVSGALERLLFWRQERAVEQADALLDNMDFDAALTAATEAAFGNQPSAAQQTPLVAEQSAHMQVPVAHSELRLIGSLAVIERAMQDLKAAEESGPSERRLQSRVSPEPMEVPPASRVLMRSTPVASQAIFMAFVFLGGLFAALSSGKFKLRMDMGPDYARVVTSDWKMWPMLLIGGVLVGFGTRLCGGCSSGHGLNGCSRLQPISILATSVFFGTAVVVSTLLLKVI